MSYTRELAKVRFRALAGLGAVGQEGQLSSPRDIFYDVTVESLAPELDHVVFGGRATRTFASKHDR